MGYDKVSGYRRTIGRGHHKNRIIPVDGFRRKAKPKTVKWVKPMEKKYEVTYYQDNQGRIVSKRRYRPII